MPSSEQQQVARRAIAEARRRRATPRELKALIAAGLVESNLQHDRYSRIGSGDRDSVGFLQQRPSQGWGPPGESVEQDTRQFLAHAQRINRRGFRGSAGQLAQAVQRSAHPGRYDQRSAEAERLLRGAGGATARRREAPGRGGPSTVEAGTAPDGQGQQLAALLLTQSLGGEPERPQSVGLATPAHAAGPVTPQGAMSVQSAGSRQESPGAALSRALAGAAGLGTGVELPPRETAESGVRTPGSGRPAAPRAIRPGGGYAGSQGVAQSLARIGHDLGLKTMSTKRHNKNPHSGDRSDHDHGNKDAYAYDISNGGAPTPEMDRTAYRIMRQLGFRDYRMGQPINTSQGVRTIKTKQGTYRVQVIYRGSGDAFGGNHLNHVHVGVKRIG